MVGRVKGVGLNHKLFTVNLVDSFYNISFSIASENNKINLTPMVHWMNSKISFIFCLFK